MSQSDPLLPLSSEELNPLLERFIAAFRQEVPTDEVPRVVLTGSYARGDAHRGSDVNLFLFVDEMPSRERQEAVHQLAYQFMKEERFPFILSLNFMPEEEYRLLEQHASGLYQHIDSHGKAIG